MKDILERLVDLHKQAITERTHNYVAHCVSEAIVEITKLRTRIFELEQSPESTECNHMECGHTVLKDGSFRCLECHEIIWTPEEARK